MNIKRANIKPKLTYFVCVCACVCMRVIDDQPGFPFLLLSELADANFELFSLENCSWPKESCDYSPDPWGMKVGHI